MVSLIPFTTTQLIVRLEKGIADGGVVDFRKVDFSNVDMRKPEARKKFTEATEIAARADITEPFLIDFTGSDISGQDFSNYDLTHAIFDNVKALHTIFYNSNISDVQMNDADVSYADFRNSNLTYTKMYNTVIVGTNFTGADLSCTCGLKFSSNAPEIIERIGVVSSIRDAVLPESVEKIRDKIEKSIIMNNTRHISFKPVVSYVNNDISVENNAPSDW